jgi:hypothetical protein
MMFQSLLHGLHLTEFLHLMFFSTPVWWFDDDGLLSHEISRITFYVINQPILLLFLLT